MKVHAMQLNKGPQYRGQDERGTLWATECGRISPNVGGGILIAGKVRRITCLACRKIRGLR